MKGNKKIVTIILTVALILIILNIYIVTNNLLEQLSYVNDQLSNFQHQLVNMRSDFENLQGNIKDELKLQSSILSSYNISYDNADAKALTGDIIIKLTPKEYSLDTSATVTLGDKVVPMNREGSIFEVVITVPIDIIYSQFIVELKEGNTIRSEVIASGDIGFINVLVNKAEANFMGEMTTYDIDNEYTYSGQIQVYSPETEVSFSEIKLFAIKNNEMIWQAEDFFHNKETGMYTLDIDETFTLEKNDRMHLSIEIKDSYGFIYKTPLYETEINGSDGVTGASEAMSPQIYDGEGKAIEFKNY